MYVVIFLVPQECSLVYDINSGDQRLEGTGNVVKRSLAVMFRYKYIHACRRFI